MGSALPLILSGPMLRQIEPEAVHVWVALSRPIEIEGVVVRFHAETGTPVEPDVPLGKGKPVFMEQIGPGLIIVVLRIEAQASIRGRYPEQQVLAYDLRTREGGRTRSLLKGLKRILIDGFSLPTFALTSSISADARILYGSCRKLHSPGSDPLITARERLQKARKNPARRYSAFFLTGDQIYADEISLFLTPYIEELGRQTVGTSELVLPVPPQLLKKYHGRRSKFLKDEAGFSTGAGDQHLMTLADFVGAYLLAWNGELWPDGKMLEQRLQQVFREQKSDEFDTGERGPGRNAGRQRNRALYRQLQDEASHLKESHKSTDAFACLAANTATYMIFDDHEVTDDWNLNQAWIAKLREPDKALGRRIVANALAAFWLFQGLANAPRAAGQPMTSAEVAERIRQYTAGNADAGLRFDTIFDRWTWSFPVLGSPPAFFLDTRTHRTVAATTTVLRNEGSKNRVSSDTKLLDQTSLEMLIHWIKELKSPVAILVSPVPVLTFSFLESLQNWFARQGQTLAELVDSEGWHSNPQGYLELLKALLQFPGEQIIFLSGDLHFGYLRESVVTTSDKKISLLQCTSSAMRNEALSIVRRILDSSFETKVMQGSRMWWPDVHDNTIASLTDPVAAQDLASVKDRFGSSFYAERSRALAINGDDSNTATSMRDAVIFDNHLGLLEVQPGAITHTFLFEGKHGPGASIYRYKK